MNVITFATMLMTGSSCAKMAINLVLLTAFMTGIWRMTHYAVGIDRNGHSSVPDTEYKAIIVVSVILDILVTHTTNLITNYFFINCIFLSLYSACITDIQWHFAYNYIWYIIVGLCVVQCILNGSNLQINDELFWLIIYLAAQLKLFAPMYGRADGYCFGCCGLIMYTLNAGLDNYVRHYIYTFVLLTVVQLLRRNINNRGNLINEVPLIPYITLALFLEITRLSLLYE